MNPCYTAVGGGLLNLMGVGGRKGFGKAIQELRPDLVLRWNYGIYQLWCQQVLLCNRKK